MKPMLPTLTFHVPTGDDWVYETKYDGFRAILYLDENVQLVSRNGKDLLHSFPEARRFFEQYKSQIERFLPLTLDGELSILVNPYKADFSKIQRRGRLKSEEKIREAAQRFPATFLAFDLLKWKGLDITSQTYMDRKEKLQSFVATFYERKIPDVRPDPFVQMVPFERAFSLLWGKITEYEGEGIVAKHVKSTWEQGARSSRWVKYKNWRRVNAFIVAYEKDNGYFHVGVYDESGMIRLIGLFKNGLETEERRALLEAVKANAHSEDDRFLRMNPGICVELFYLEWYEDTLREPYFSRFLFNVSPKECTFSQITEKDRLSPVEITHPEKPLWENPSTKKKDYIHYLTKIYPYMGPFLKMRPLTVIRYPHGMFGEAFYQKNCPDYAPDFVDTHVEDGIRYILCNNFNTFMWLGNQLAIEFHIPFRTIERKNPSEIVIDLDPPTKAQFDWAKEAALYMKDEIVDPLGLTAFIKVSGKRGLQLYVPLSDPSFTWEETRLFTKFAADLLLAKNEKHFTTERLKKNRKNRLYVDYIQHAEGKTIIAPFSVRGNERAGVAAPIFWEELHKNIEPDGFSMDQVLKRLSEKGNPFDGYFQAENEGPLKEILSFLKRKG